MYSKDYKPTITLGHEGTACGTIAVDLTACGHCSKWMLSDRFSSLLFLRDQIKQAGWVFESESEKNGKTICVDCRDSDVATFKCYACKQVCLTSRIKVSFGLPSVSLCMNCYETLSAKQWDEIVAELEEGHRHDFD